MSEMETGNVVQDCLLRLVKESKLPSVNDEIGAWL
jgi:hypothetical protein